MRHARDCHPRSATSKNLFAGDHHELFGHIAFGSLGFRRIIAVTNNNAPAVFRAALRRSPAGDLSGNATWTSPQAVVQSATMTGEAEITYRLLELFDGVVADRETLTQKNLVELEKIDELPATKSGSLLALENATVPL
ncbi:MAG: hypothetical protein ACKO81_02230 [Planctomycetota bacterium]